jgi:hypothetical protein
VGAIPIDSHFLAELPQLLSCSLLRLESML